MRLKLFLLGGCALCLALTLAGSTAFANNAVLQNNVILADPPVSTAEPSSLALMGMGFIGFSVLVMLLRSKKSEDAKPRLSQARSTLPRMESST